jgi:hypothetical protein
MNNKDLKAWLEKEADDKRDSSPFNQYDDGWYDCIGAVLDRLDPDPEPGGTVAGGMDPAMRAELERVARGEKWRENARYLMAVESLFAQHLLDTYGGRIQEVE